MRKKILLAFVALLFVFVSVSYAASTEIRAQLNNGLKFVLNGKAWTPPSAPISYKGTTYLPVRAVAEATGSKVGYNSATQTITIDKSSETYDAIIEFPANKYPQTAAHIASAIMAGKSAICTVNRDGADKNREQALAGIPTKDGYDRDEWPMAVCAEGGAGADVAYVESADNRGAGAFIGNALEKYKDGTRVKIVLVYERAKAQPSEQKDVTYASCAEAKAAGAAPLKKGDPGYSAKLDRDGDGIACEN